MKGSTMKYLLKQTLLACAIAIASCSAAFAQSGLYWESTTTISAINRTTNEKGYAMPDMIKSVNDGGMWSVVRMDRQTMYNVNDNEKTYWMMTFAHLDSMSANASNNMAAMQQQMKDRMANMSDEQKAQMQKMMGDRLNAMNGGGSDSTVVTKTGDTKSIAGYDCTKYIGVNGKDTTTVWATTGIKAPPELRKQLVDFQKKTALMSRGRMRGVAAMYSQIDGYPMVIQTANFTRSVTKIELKDTPSSEFDLPADYKQVDQPAMGGRGGRGRRGGDNGGGGDNKDNN
jgi:hypothetical protein